MEQTEATMTAYEREYIRAYRAAREDAHYARLNMSDAWGSGRPDIFYRAKLRAAQAEIKMLEANMPDTIKPMFGITD